MAFKHDHIFPTERKPDRKVSEYSVFDVEANNWKEFVVCGFYDGKEYRDFGSMLEFLLSVSEGGKDRTIYAHNGGKYDFLFVMDCIFVEGADHFRLEELMPRGSALLGLKIRRMYKNKDGERIEGPVISFRDSLAILPFSLKSLTKSFNTECAKGEWDHSKHKDRNDKKLLEYLRADCVGLYQVLEKYFNWPLIKECGAGVTVANQAMRVFQTTIDKKIPSCPAIGGDSVNVDKFVRRSYFGGRTEIFRPYFKAKGKQKVSCFDVNSLYPSVMRDFEYPTKFRRWIFDKYEPSGFGVWAVTVEVPKDMYVPPLGLLLNIDPETKTVFNVMDSSQGKLIFPTGVFSGVWTNVELNYAISLGVKILKVDRGAVFDSGGKIFEEYINEIYGMRMAAEKESVDSFLCKLLMNSLYGRFGLKREKEEWVEDEGQNGITDVCYEIDTGRKTEDGFRIVRRLVSQPKMIESYTNVAIASFVTSYARIRMHKEYMKKLDLLYYTDTDSEFLLDLGDIESSKELGKFKYEYSATEACFLLPKTYALAGITGLKDVDGKIIEAKTIAKGISRDAIKSRNPKIGEYREMLEGDVRRAEGGIPFCLEFMEKESLSRIKTAMRKGTFLDVTDARPKVISAAYDKREIYVREDGEYDTRPIHIENGLAMNYRDPNFRIEAKRGRKRKVKITVEGDRK